MEIAAPPPKMEDLHLFLFEGFPKGASVQCNGEVGAVVRAGCGDGNVEGGGEEQGGHVGYV